MDFFTGLNFWLMFLRNTIGKIMWYYLQASRLEILHSDRLHYVVLWYVNSLSSTVCPENSGPPYVKYSNTHNTEQKSLKIT